MLINKRNNQNGQAIPIGIALFLVLGLMSFVLFNTGQTVSDKSRLVNTADSAVYSGLLWQARAMNFQAYTNRAMVANQVAMAQAVSLNSWSAYIKKTGENLNLAFGWVPIVGGVTAVMETIGRGIDLVVNPVSQGMLAVVNAVNASLSIAQEAMYYSSFVATPDVINSVVKSNEPDNQDFKWTTAFSIVNTGMNLHAWTDFTESSDSNRALAENERFHMINASMDKFSKERNWKFFNFFIPVTPLNWVRFEKAGTTEFTRRNGKYEFYAKDALSLRLKRYTWRGKRYSDIPVSGGSSLANSDGSEGTIRDADPTFFGGRHEIAQERVTIPIPQGFHEGRSMRNYSGIHAYRSLSAERRDQEDPPTLKLRLQINMNTDDMMDSHDRQDDSDNSSPEIDFNANVEMPGKVMSSVGTAEMYFKRPCFEANCIEEYANGYSPYWDVRLVNTSGLSRLAAHTLQDGVLTDTDISKTSSMSGLDSYSGALATPITDYIEQAKGVSVLIGGMENHLTTLVENSPEYQQYQARIDSIRQNVSDEISTIASQFVEQDFTKDELIEEIAKAAGYDLEIGEFKIMEDYLAEEFPELDELRDFDIDQLKDSVMSGVDDVVEDLKTEIESQLTDILRNAVRNIMAGMISSFVEQTAGIGVFADVITEASEGAADDLVDSALNAATGSDSDDISIDLSSECAIYNTVHQAEVEVADMQARLEAINQQIADEFHVELETATNEAIANRTSLNNSIAALEDQIAVISSPSNNANSDDRDDEIRRLTTEIQNLQQANDEIPGARVETLTRKLMQISNDATRSEFPDYELEYRYAERAVIDTLGDIASLQIDANGDPVTSNLPSSEAENEVASDSDQTFTERPEGC